jgi:drug/metabolite transporter (DMT)-like permease
MVMNWLFPALLAPAVLTITIFTDKYIVGKAVKDYRGVVLLQAVMGFIVGTLFWVVTGFPILSPTDAFIVLSTGVINTFAAAVYFKVLKEEDASYVIFMFQLIPIFVIILSFIFLEETVSARQLLGFVIILLSSLLMSVEDWKKISHVPKSFWLLVLMDLLFALAAVLIKFAINATSFSQILSYESWGIGIGGIILYVLFPFIRKAFNEIITTVGKRILGIMFLNEGIYVLSKSLAYFAYSIGPVALVSVLGSTQVFFGILFGWFLTLLLPQIFNEKINREILLRKVVLAVVLVFGIILIY